RIGIIVKSSATLEQLAAVRTAAFDKTGTLTYGEPRVSDIHAQGSDADELLTLAAAVEQYSGHPLAAGIVDHARTAGHTVPTAQDVAEIPANGVRGTVQGRAVVVGSARFIQRETRRDSLPLPHGATAVHVAVGQRYAGYLALADALRTETPATMAALHRAGVRTTM